MTFCHFASDILNMLLLTFVSSLVCWVPNKAELLSKIQRESMRKQRMEKLKEINSIDPNERQGLELRASTDKGRWKGLTDEKE